MKKFEGHKAYLVFALILGTFISVLPGCGGAVGGGKWDKPGDKNSRPAVATSVPSATAPVATVLPDTAITVVFNKDMDAATITSGTFTVARQDLTPVAGAAIPVTYDAVSRTATFHPAATLAPGSYTATVRGTGTSAATDTSGNALAGNPSLPLAANDYVWSFTTSLTAPALRPTVTTTVPATSNPIPTVLSDTAVTATFSKEMAAASITSETFTVTKLDLTRVAGIAIPVTYNAATKTASFHPAAPLAAGTYIATIKGTGPNAATDSSANALAGDPALPLVANDYVWRFTTASTVPTPTPTPGALTLQTFGIASAGGITNTGATKINGNVVLDPNATCNNEPILLADGPGFGLCGGNPANVPTKNSSDQVITQTYPDTTTADTVMAALKVKWNSLSPAALPSSTLLGCGTIGSLGDDGALIGCSGNATLAPGTYISSTGKTIGIAGTLTLNGTANDVWVFQAPSALTTAADTKIILTGGAKASNVWWFVGSSATLGTLTDFQGNILSSASISMLSGATSCGQLLAGAEGAGTFTFLSNTVSVPGHSNAPASCK